jgi:Mg-chelatase subunit ChlD
MAARGAGVTLPFGLGALRLDAPLFLLALLALPIFLLPAGRVRGARLAAACRTLAAAALVLALAGLALERPRPATGTCVVAAIDVSASVGAAARDRAASFLAALLPSLGPADTIGAVAFAADARVVAHPAAGRRALAALLPQTADEDAGESDLAAAIGRAAPLCPAWRHRVVVLFSDGNETQGAVLAEVALDPSPPAVFPVPPAARALPAAAVRRLLAPPLVAAGAALPVAAVVEARAETTAALALTADGRALPPLPLDLAPGVTVVPLPLRVHRPGHHLLEARLQLPPATPPAPGAPAAAVTATVPLRVLVASEREHPVVAAALAARGVETAVVPPGAVAADLAGRHLVVLDDVASAALPRPVLAALERHVAAGGGLVVTGGAHLFGDAGFVGTPLERLMPVSFQSQTPEPREREPIALYLVIDRSNSMGQATGDPGGVGGEKMEYAKRAALAVLDQLGPSDLVGAVAFDSRPWPLGRLEPASRGRAPLGEQIRTLRYGGGTDFKDALEIALRDLLESGRRVRHVILLTDGDTNRRADDHAQLIGAFAHAEISITTIRIGNDTVNLDLLGTISRMTGGEFHHVERPHVLPQLMIRDTQRRLDRAADRADRPARIAEAGPILAGFTEETLPPVTRWAVTRPRTGAELRLYVEADGRRDPLLATWQYELGRVAVVPLDFQAAAAGWATWPGFSTLWAQLARWAAPPALPTEHRLVARPERAGTAVRLETFRDDPGPFTLALAEGPPATLRQTARRRFEAVLPRLAPGVHRARLAGPDATPAEVEVAVPATAAGARETRALGPNHTLLAALAAATGGRVDPLPADVLAAPPGAVRERRPLAGLLVPLVLALVLADVAARRLAR